MGTILSVPLKWIEQDCRGDTFMESLRALPHFEYARQVLEGKTPPPLTPSQKAYPPRSAYDLKRVLQDEPWPGPYPAYLRRDGMFSILDGHHRLVRWLLEGVDTVQISLEGTDPEWASLDATLCSFYPSPGLYQEIEHPYFQYWGFIRDPARTTCIRNHLLSRMRSNKLWPGSPALEIGCHTGRVAREMNRLGLATTAVDYHRPYLVIGEFLNRVFGTRVNYRMEEFSVFLKSARSWNVLVALSVFHHWLKTEGDRERLRYILRVISLKADCLIIDIPALSTHDAYCIQKDINPVQAEDLYFSCFPLHTRKLLGEFDGRRVFALEKDG